MSLDHVLGSDWSYRLGWTVVHSLWEGSAAAAVLMPALWLLRFRSPQSRYGAGLAALGMTLAGAMITFASMRPPSRPAPLTLSRKQAPAVSVGNGARPYGTASVQFTQFPDAGVDEILARHNRFRLRGIVPGSQPQWMPSISGGWLLGVLLLSVWRLGGWLAAQRLKVLGVEPVGSALAATLARIGKRLRVRRSVRVMQSALAQTPMVVGWLRPVVLMPVAALANLTPQQVEAILAHELAHVRRHDYLLNLFQVFAETLLFYHPAVWWMSRRIRLERERCCDEIAAELCGDRRAYVESLVAVEEARLGGALAMAARGSGGAELLDRIRRLLGVPEDASRRTARGIAAAVIWTAAALAAIVGPRLTGSAAAEPGTPSAPLSTTRPASLKPAVLLVTPGNYLLERAMEALDLSVVTMNPAEFNAHRNSNPAGQVIVFDRWSPPVAPPVPALYVGIVAPGSTLSVRDSAGQLARVKDVSVSEWSREHPTLRDLDLGKVHVAQALQLRAAEDWHTLARGTKGPLILVRDDLGGRQILIGFDVLQSNWPMQTSFPIFLHRSIEWLLREEPTATKQPTNGSDPQPAPPDPGPATSPVAMFRADCVLSTLADGKRKVLASPMLNLQDGRATSFLFTGKPPVVIQQLPARDAGILGTVSIQKQSDGRLRVVCHISRQAANGEGTAAENRTNLELMQKFAAIEKAEIEAEMLERAAEDELSYRQGMGKFGGVPYTSTEIARADPEMAENLKELDATQYWQMELRSRYGAKHPQVLTVNGRLEALKKRIDEAVKRFNEGSLIVMAAGSHGPQVVSRDISKLWKIVLAYRRAEDELRSALKDIHHVGAVGTDQTVKPGERVAVELDDGTCLEVSVHPIDR